MAKPRLSLCMIARNEEAFLPGCLESVRGTVDEIVLVDTGSTDRTLEIARAAGAVVVERPWDDDFAAPRTLAARSASGAWILQLDADERLAPGAGAAILGACARTGLDLGMLPLHNATRIDAPAREILTGAARHGRPVLVPRLIRNTGDVEYTGVVHENVGEWLLRRGGRRLRVDADLIHLGYVESTRLSRAKRERNLGLLRKRCALEPENVTAPGYLALELLEAREFEAAAEVVEKAWALLELQPRTRSFIRIAVARGLLALRRPDPAAALEAVSRAEAQDGPHPDLDCLRGFAREVQAVRARPGTAERADRLREAEAALRAGLERITGGEVREFQGAINEAGARLHLSVVHLLQGRPAEALAEASAALRADPENPSAWTGAAEALLALGQPAKALAAVQRSLGPRPDGWLVAAGAARELGAVADARTFLARAQERSARGYEYLHRWSWSNALARALESPA
jgi:tetratricopeptide (TPR) repeat protein